MFRSYLLFFFGLFLSFNVTTGVSGKEFELGKSIFQENCSVCHQGGNNRIIPEKNLRLQTLKSNGMNSISAITYQVINGKNGMPAFGGRLKEKDIEEVAAYILNTF